MTTPATQDTDRLSKLEGAYEQINERFNDLRAEMNQRFNDLREEVRQGDAALREEMNERLREIRSEMHRQTYLIIGVIGGLVTLLRFIG